jgi:ribosomal subunit interface protein
VTVNAVNALNARAALRQVGRSARLKSSCGAESLRRFPTSIRSSPTGATMNVSISYRHVDSQQAVALEVTRRLDKLGRLLKSYQPDLVQIKGVFSKNQRTEEQSLALTLSLPTGTLRATGNGKNVLAGCKKAFSEIELQIKKHQSLLRREHEWKRKRPVHVE